MDIVWHILYNKSLFYQTPLCTAVHFVLIAKCLAVPAAEVLHYRQWCISIWPNLGHPAP